MKTIFNILILVFCIILINSCKKDKPTIPVLTTTPVSEISYTTAKSGGDSINEGGAQILSIGVCWNKSVDPTIANNKTTESSGLVTFTSNITQLAPNTVYYVRAYATNSAGTGYGNQVSFTTIPIAIPLLTTTAITSITEFSALSGGNISEDNGGTVTARGVCWAKAINPTTNNSKTTDGIGIGVFSSSITGLEPGTTYYVRAYANNSEGTAYGNEISFTTNAIIPILTTTEVSAITSTSAVIGGNVTSDGGATVTMRGICWSTSQHPVSTNNKTTDGAGTGTFSSSISGLLGSTTYFVRAYATNSVGTAYGNEISFTTSQSTLPVLSTTSVSAITAASAICGGTVTSDGGTPVTLRGVCWSTSENPTTSDSKTSDGSGIGTYSNTLTGLTYNTTYYVRAYSCNSLGTQYGNQVSFKTNPVIPTLTTIPVSSIKGFSSISGGNISNNGGSPVSLRGVCWSFSENPTTSDNKTMDGSGIGVYLSNLKVLAQNTTYFVRAYAVNDAGTGYGNTISFTTQNCPTIFNESLTYGKVTDIDGNDYKTITISTQVWMAENLKTITYSDGTSIPLITDETTWAASSTPGYCWYNNNSAFKTSFGALYNWYSVNTGKLCPTGWHVPSLTEWTILITYLGGESVASYKLKETGITHWNDPNNCTNSSGFTSLPGGCRLDEGFLSIGNIGNWWSSSDYEAYMAWFLPMFNSNGSIYKTPYYKRSGYSVRCIKD
jgi:uncharacterized protein (TIGR02145 family)